MRRRDLILEKRAVTPTPELVEHSRQCESRKLLLDGNHRIGELLACRAPGEPCPPQNGDPRFRAVKPADADQSVLLYRRESRKTALVGCVDSVCPPARRTALLALCSPPGFLGAAATGEGSPHFSPNGEAKCMRGASVRGARRLTSAGVLDSTLSTASKRNEGMAGLSCASVAIW